MYVAAILVLSGVFSVGVTPLIRRLAFSWGGLDRAINSRKVHERSVPRLGGLGIVGGAYGAGLAALLLSPVRQALFVDGARTCGLAIGGLAIAALGVYDDLRGANARKKFAVQFSVAIALYLVGYRIEVVRNPFGGQIDLGLLSAPVTLLWIAGISNAVNLIDGLDGLAGGISLCAALAVFSVGAFAGDVPAMILSIALVGGILGFLVYNVNPASIFMGDTGSLFLGTMLAALALHPRPSGSRAVPLVSMVVILGIPVADTLLAMARRFARGAPLFSADRDHLHHKLLDLGFSHRRAVIVLWAGAALLAAAGTQMACGAHNRAAILVVTVLVELLLLNRLRMIRLPDRALLERRERNLERRRAVRVAADRLRRATRIGDIQDGLYVAVPALEARALWLRRAAAAPVTDAPVSATHAGATALRSRFPLDPTRPELGALHVSWGARKQLDRDTEIALELLCNHVASAVERIAPRQRTAPVVEVVREELDRRRKRPAA